MNAQGKRWCAVALGMVTAVVVSAAIVACETPATAPVEATPAANIIPEGTRRKMSGSADPLLLQQAVEAARAAEAAGDMQLRTRQRRPATAEELAKM